MSLFTITYGLFYLGSTIDCLNIEFEPCLMVVHEPVINKGVGKFRDARPGLVLNGGMNK